MSSDGSCLTEEHFIVKLAVLSDIHSNAFALQAVLDDISHREVDHVINLGDILYGPIAPFKTYLLLQQHPCVTISGNQDRQIWQASPEDIEANATMAFIHKDLGEEPLEWMMQLPSELQLTDDIYLCHGIPGDDMIYLLEDVSDGRPVLRSQEEILKLIKGNTSSLILCGHTHIPRTVQLETGQLVVNPGSVGLPAYRDDEPCLHSMENYSPHASYAIIEQKKKRWNVEHIRVDYDYATAARLSTQRERGDWAHYLTTGRAL